MTALWSLLLHSVVNCLAVEVKQCIPFSGLFRIKNHTCSTGLEDSCKISVNEEYLCVNTVTSTGSFKISEKVSMDLDLAG